MNKREMQFDHRRSTGGRINQMRFLSESLRRPVSAAIDVNLAFQGSSRSSDSVFFGVIVWTPAIHKPRPFSLAVDESRLLTMAQFRQRRVGLYMKSLIGP
jgi:hypothetical protein